MFSIRSQPAAAAALWDVTAHLSSVPLAVPGGLGKPMQERVGVRRQPGQDVLHSQKVKFSSMQGTNELREPGDDTSPELLSQDRSGSCQPPQELLLSLHFMEFTTFPLQRERKEQQTAHFCVCLRGQ